MNLAEYRKIYSADDAAPGWDAIDRVVKALYPGQEPRHLAAVPHYSIGGKDPIDGISFYDAEVDGQVHTHIVTYGFSNLYYDEEALDSDFSKFGFELTFRVKPYAEDPDGPIWAANMIQNIARYVFKSGKWFEPYHCLNAGGPNRLDTDTRLVALAFVSDPQLDEIDTPHGKVQFIQMFGLTEHEMQSISEGTAVKDVIDRHRRDNPLLITDLERGDI